jgi:hypothetical protein
MKNNITQNMILDSVDEDISEHFSSLEDGSFMPLLPIYIHLARHLGKISKSLSFDSHNYGSNSTNGCCKCKNYV